MKIVLVRHGRSAHVHAGWIDRAGFLRWREAYEAAGIDDAPPAELCASVSGVVVSSTARRAVESARALAPGREVLISPLLRELDLIPLPLERIRLPLFGWALVIGLGMLRPVSSDEEQRTRAAADWLEQLAAQHESVMAVTHHTFRSRLSRELVRRGWRCDVPRRKSRHWSAWPLSRP